VCWYRENKDKTWEWGIDMLGSKFSEGLTFSFLNMSATMLSAVVRELGFMELPLIWFSGSARGSTHTQQVSREVSWSTT